MFNLSFFSIFGQFVSSCCWYTIAYNLLGHSLEIILLSFGPFEATYCHAINFIKGVIISQWIYLQIGIVLIRHLYVFALKNPAILQNDFWCLFINLVTLMLSIVCEFTHQFLPGKDHIAIYLCRGTDPRPFVGQKAKMNIPALMLLSIWLILFFYSLIKIQIYKCKEPLPVALSNQQSQTMPSALDNILKTSLAGFLSVFSCLLVMAIGITLISYLNKLNYSQMNSSPNYQLLHFTFYSFPFFGLGTYLMLFFVRQKSMRKTILTEFFELCDMIKERLCCLN